MSTPRRTPAAGREAWTSGRFTRPSFVHASRPGPGRPPSVGRPRATGSGRFPSTPPGPVPAGRQAGTSPSHRIGPVLVPASRHRLPPTAKPGRTAAPSGRFSSTVGATIPARREAWTPPASGPTNRPTRPSFVHASPHDPRRPPSWDVRPPHRAVLRPRLPARSRPAAKAGRSRATGSGRFSSTPPAPPPAHRGAGTHGRPVRPVFVHAWSDHPRPPRSVDASDVGPGEPAPPRGTPPRPEAPRPAPRHPGRPPRGTPLAPPANRPPPQTPVAYAGCIPG